MVSVLPRPGPEPVYNLEVAVEHVYHVSSTGVLARNTDPFEPSCLSETPGEGPKVVGGSSKIPRVGSSRPDLPVRRRLRDPTEGRFNDKKPLFSGRDGGDGSKVRHSGGAFDVRSQ